MLDDRGVATPTAAEILDSARLLRGDLTSLGLYLHGVDPQDAGDVPLIMLEQLSARLNQLSAMLDIHIQLRHAARPQEEASDDHPITFDAPQTTP